MCITWAETVKKFGKMAKYFIMFSMSSIPLDTPYLIIYALTLVLIILIVVIVRFELRLRRLMRGKNARSLEEAFNIMDNEIKTLHGFNRELQQYLNNVERRLRRSVQSVETIRYNPFQGTGEGGNQSFVTTFLNEDGDGLIISSVFSRERTSVFGKPIKTHNSPFELTPEENESLTRAKSRMQ